MKQSFDSPFASIDDAHEYLTLLAQTIFETKLDIEADVERGKQTAMSIGAPTH